MDLNPANWDTNERRAAGRHVLNSACSVVATLAVVGLVSSPDASTITTALNQIGHGVGEVVSGIAVLAGVLGPIYTALKAKTSASPDSQVKSVVENLKRNGQSTIPDNQRKEIIGAVAEMPEVKGIVTISTVAAETPSPKVVASASQIPAS